MASHTPAPGVSGGDAGACADDDVLACDRSALQKG